jgi:hypothetical protein
MAAHSRHIRGKLNSGRTQIRFKRIDLLWEGDAVNRATGEILTCPLPRTLRNSETNEIIGHDERYAIGPTILDMMVREIVKWGDLPRESRPKNADPAMHVAVWKVRDTRTLWPAAGQPQVSRPRREAEDEDTPADDPDHPFLAALASGGLIVRPTAAAGWTTVEKPSTVNLAAGIYRLAVGMYGSIDAAYREISRQAALLWQADLARVLEIWGMIRAMPGHLLIEDEDVEKLRPLSSVSQELERVVMREACVYLGIDPDLDVGRSRGRPVQPENTGDFLRMDVDPEGRVTGEFLRSFHGVRQGAKLGDLDVMTMVEVMGALRAQKFERDAEFLDAYLDLVAPDWREQAADEVFSATAPGPDDNPYDVLGVTPEMADDEVAAVFKALMNAVRHLANHAPVRRFTAAYKAIRVERKAKETQS